VPTSDITEAGTDYDRSYESGTGKVRIDITNDYWDEYFGYNWELYVHKQDVLWDSEIKIFARRTSNGTPENSYWETTVTGGNNYTEILNSERLFFFGLRGSNNIRVQYKLEGISLLIPVANYRTYITFTIVGF
jgi:hypothetical protein